MEKAYSTGAASRNPLQDVLRIFALKLPAADAFESDRFEVFSVRDHGVLPET